MCRPTAGVRPCYSTATTHALTHTHPHPTKTKSPGQPCHSQSHSTLILLRSVFSSYLPDACSSTGSPPDSGMGLASTQTCVVVTHHWRWYLLLLLWLCLHAGGHQTGSYDEVLVNCNYSCVCVNIHTHVWITTFIPALPDHCIWLWKAMNCLA